MNCSAPIEKSWIMVSWRTWVLLVEVVLWPDGRVAAKLETSSGFLGKGVGRLHVAIMRAG
jgi:hypothetical protein